MLAQASILLLAAVLLVPLCSRLGLGSVLGYLIAGVLTGPAVFAMVSDVDGILHVSEFGVVLLLFVIGLELQPARLWVLRRLVFGMGSAQVLATGAVIALVAVYFGLSWQAAVVAGLGLAMSSTALVIQTLADKGQLTSRHGREGFAVLLFQDLAVIPLIALLPLLSSGADEQQLPGWQMAWKSVLIIAAAVMASRLLIRPLLRAAIISGGREIFTAAALLLVIGASLLMVWAGLSMSLGAFLAGVLLADSEYRHELEAAIGPFKGLFLGLFFMAVGMSANLGLVLAEPFTVFGLALLLIAIKALVLFVLRYYSGAPAETSRKLAFALAQGGEFAFVLFTLAQDYRIFDRDTAELLVVVVTISMLLWPLLLLLDEKILTGLKREPAPVYDTIDQEATPVVIAGYGRFGQVVSRLLNTRRIAFTALDSSPRQVDFVRRFGNKVYYGDSTQIDLLYAAKVDQAKLFVLAVGDVDRSIKTAELVRRHFPHVPIFARARNRFHAHKLMDIGVKVVMRETLHSSVELGRDILNELGVPKDEVGRLVAAFLEFDQKLLMQQHAVYQDEEKLIQTSKEAADELRSLFEAAQREAEVVGAAANEGRTESPPLA